MYKLFMVDGNPTDSPYFLNEMQAREWAFDNGGCRNENEWETNFILYKILNDSELARLVYCDDSDTRYPDNTYLDSLLEAARIAGHIVIPADDDVHCLFYVV